MLHARYGTDAAYGGTSCTDRRLCSNPSSRPRYEPHPIDLRVCPVLPQSLPPSLAVPPSSCSAPSALGLRPCARHSPRPAVSGDLGQAVRAEVEGRREQVQQRALSSMRMFPLGLNNNKHAPPQYQLPFDLQHAHVNHVLPPPLPPTPRLRYLPTPALRHLRYWRGLGLYCVWVGRRYAERRAVVAVVVLCV
eukprot:3024372-Rhodomonas_salina.1